jgi:hypothetical protein|nr:hypothetical protein [uncultured Lachnoclostridium sp.]
MMKRKLFLIYFLLLIFLLCSCSLIKTEEINLKVPEPTAEGSSEATFEFSDGYFNEQDIIELFSLCRGQIESKIGTDYNIKETGAEGTLTLYMYPKYDIQICYFDDIPEEDASHEEVRYIGCGDNINFYGVHIGMTYNEIKEIIPNVTIQSSSPEADVDIVYYRLKIDINNMEVYGEIADENSPITYMYIYKN